MNKMKKILMMIMVVLMLTCTVAGAAGRPTPWSDTNVKIHVAETFSDRADGTITWDDAASGFWTGSIFFAWPEADHFRIVMLPQPDDLRLAVREMGDFIRESGAKLYFYVRPPTGKVNYGCTSLQQCEKLDTLFTHLSEKHGGECIYVNRAFAEAIWTTDYNLWGDDNAHTGKLGGYLTVCTFFKALTGKSPTALSYNGLDETTAQTLQDIADAVI